MACRNTVENPNVAEHPERAFGAIEHFLLKNPSVSCFSAVSINGSFGYDSSPGPCCRLIRISLAQYRPTNSADCPGASVTWNSMAGSPKYSAGLEGYVAAARSGLLLADVSRQRTVYG